MASSYRDAVTSSPQSCLRCKLTREVRGDNLKVISMSLYGDNPRYIIGALRNAQLLPVVFPGWTLRFYCRFGADVYDEGGGGVLKQVVYRLRELGAEVKDIGTELVPDVPPMLWRMLALEDLTVDVLLSRDADSRLSDRDAAAVNDWLWAVGQPAFHCVRDHPSHAQYSVNGGLWGARRRRLVDLMGGGPVTPMLANYGSEYMDDMRFLEERVWTRLVSRSPQEVLCHDSVSCDSWVGALALTTPRSWPGEHVGQVYDARSNPRQGDVDLLLNADRNFFCEGETRITLATDDHDEQA